jgi:Mrp family chromosome partitioning ATPase
VTPRTSRSTALVPRADVPRTLAVQGDRLLPVDCPDSEAADGYLRLTAHILLQAQRRPFQTVGVISARDGDGKTTAAVNLAVCLGRTRGRLGRVLLVDGDARRRTLTRLLCGPDPADASPEELAARHPMVVATGFANVDLMTAPWAPDSLTLHDPGAWAQTLEELRGRYGQIVLDCPSVLDDPEGMVLRECVEELVLVVKAGATTRGALERALTSVRKRVIGVLLHGGRGRERTRGGVA